jgi:hypothetical protein
MKTLLIFSRKRDVLFFSVLSCISSCGEKKIFWNISKTEFSGYFSNDLKRPISTKFYQFRKCTATYYKSSFILFSTHNIYFDEDTTVAKLQHIILREIERERERFLDTLKNLKHTIWCMKMKFSFLF